jgi:CIC family chloride channel protein
VVSPAEVSNAPRTSVRLDRRIFVISGLAVLVAFGAGFMAQALTRLIGLITNLAFHQRLSTELVSPAGNNLGPWVMLVPVGGALIVGLMARFGSKAIRGHGIPEAMEQVLFNQSRIPPRLTFLKPISAAISIGTGGPFGAEGPIISTGSALGSLVGQLLPTTSGERKTLLAAGAAAGMAATFGSPVSAVLLAIELLLFEYRPRSIIPVALASATATGVRAAFVGSGPIFPIHDLGQPGGRALAAYILLGALVGVAAIYVTRAVYALEDGFEKLPIHWMWWPALGAVVVGVIGYFSPHTLGVGYDNIEGILAGDLVGRGLVILCTLKFVSWAVSLASGTSGGTLAPLFTIGGGLGSALGGLALVAFPELGLDVRIAALVGMAAMFAGASHALLASVVFVFEVTQQPLGLLPVLGGCTAAFLVSTFWMRHSIMTEKIARRGARVLSDYAVDFLDTVLVRDGSSRSVVSLPASKTLDEVRSEIGAHAAGMSHQGFPVLDDQGLLVGVLTRRDLLDPGKRGDLMLGQIIQRPPMVAYEDSSLREAADHMLSAGVGRLPVVTRAEPRRVVGMLTRSDLLGAHDQRLAAERESVRGLALEDLLPGL